MNGNSRGKSQLTCRWFTKNYPIWTNSKKTKKKSEQSLRDTWSIIKSLIFMSLESQKERNNTNADKKYLKKDDFWFQNHHVKNLEVTTRKKGSQTENQQLPCTHQRTEYSEKPESQSWQKVRSRVTAKICLLGAYLCSIFITGIINW